MYSRRYIALPFDGLGWDGMGWDGLGCAGLGWDWLGLVGIGWDLMDVVVYVLISALTNPLQLLSVSSMSWRFPQLTIWQYS